VPRLGTRNRADDERPSQWGIVPECPTDRLERTARPWSVRALTLQRASMVCGLQGVAQEPGVELEHHLLPVRGSGLIDGRSDEGPGGGLVPNCTLLGCLLG